MAVFQGNISLTSEYTLALATVFVVLLSLEHGQVEASGCDFMGSIMGPMEVCVGLNSVPAPGSPCCNAVCYVRYNIQPDYNCVCSLATNPLLGQWGLDASKIACMIRSCIGESQVPSCLN